MITNISHPTYWDQHYVNGRAQWDLGHATPVFEVLLQQNHLQPGKMIVLGAGAGHDARLFAAAGFDVTAVDFSLSAVRLMHVLNKPQAEVTIMQADIFELPAELNGSFDYVLEYTCYCAIDPAQRPAYYRLVDSLLQPGGQYVALAFPVGNHTAGPPFAVDPQEMIAALTAHGLQLRRQERPANSVPARRDSEELIVMQKPAQEQAVSIQ